MEGYKPAKSSVALIATGISALLVIAFALLLRADIRAPKDLTAADWPEAEPAGFQYAFTAESEGGALTVRGWTCIEGERLLTVGNYVALYNRATGEYLRLPTAMEFDEEPTVLINDGITYDRAGFTSITPLKFLSGDFEEYEICFAYGNNGHKALVHTGVLLGEGGGHS